MKRSELNSIIEDTIKFMEDRGLPLPPFAYWGVPEWKAAGQRERRDCRKYARMGYHRFRKWRF